MYVIIIEKYLIKIILIKYYVGIFNGHISYLDS